MFQAPQSHSASLDQNIDGVQCTKIYEITLTYRINEGAFNERPLTKKLEN